MTRKFKVIKTPLGIVEGRDGIYLDEVIYKDRTNKVILRGSLNGCLCDKGDKDKVEFSDFELVFNGVLASKIIELDSWDWDSTSSFDEVIESDWIKDLGGKVTSKNRHFLVQTYDDVIEVVCDSFELKLLPTSTEQNGVTDA